MIISGKELSAKLKAEMAEQVDSFPAKYGWVPHLVVILVGDDPGRVSYVTGNAKASVVVGYATPRYAVPIPFRRRNCWV